MFLYIILALIIFAMNIIPGFMPPTWIVLTFIYLRYHLSFIAVVLIGASCATLGRIVLYYLAKYHFHRFFSEESKKNLQSIGLYLNSRKRISIPILIGYAFFPIPSNQVYIAAGLANLDIRIMAGSFFVGRLISYSFWAGSVRIAASSFDKIFSHYYSRPIGIVIDLLGFGVLYGLSLINWKKLLKIKK